MAVERIDNGPRHVTYRTDTVDASGANVSDAIPVASFAHGGWQVVHAGATTQVTYRFESTIDGVNWDPIAGAVNLTTSGASGSRSESFSNVAPAAQIRLAITGPDTGTLQVFYIAKGT